MILQSVSCSCLLKGLNPSKVSNTSRRKRYYLKICANLHDEGNQEDALKKGLVDSNIAMLYSRISQLKSKDIIEMIEPIEKGHCATLFESNNLEILGLVQFEDLIERPRVAIGFSVMASFCLPVSVIVIMLYLMDMAKVVVDRVSDVSSNDNLNQLN
jgi:hypothetical protein